MRYRIVKIPFKGDGSSDNPYRPDFLDRIITMWRQVEGGEYEVISVESATRIRSITGIDISGILPDAGD